MSFGHTITEREDAEGIEQAEDSPDFNLYDQHAVIEASPHLKFQQGKHSHRVSAD